jgi:hypothetical protein
MGNSCLSVCLSARLTSKIKNWIYNNLIPEANIKAAVYISFWFVSIKLTLVVSVGTAGIYEPDSRSRFLAGTRDLSLLLCVQTCCGAHPASYSLGTPCFSPRKQIHRGVKLKTHIHLVPRSRMLEL